MRRAALPPIVVAMVAVAALLSGAAVYLVQQAGCDDPGHYVRIGDTVELVGGCLRPGDLPVGPAPAQPDAREHGAQVRP
jgi:hypothetical protein